MPWIHISDKPALKEGCILVWGTAWPKGPVVVKYGWQEWRDVVEDVAVEFEYWHPIEASPYAGSNGEDA